MGSISIRSVDKFYGSSQALFGINLNIADGEFIVLVGPSGCGKSTLLRTIAGLESISAGDIVIGGESVKGVAPRDRDLAMVFQNYALYPHMTVRENICFSMRLKKVPITTQDERVAEVAEILGLEPHMLDRYPKELSGGQRQRVGMGRAIVRKPRAFLFDEPLSNLDAKLRVQMRTEIKDMHQRLKTTSVYVTHDQIEAMTMADRIVILEDGHIRQVGSPLELYDQPVNTFVAGFIGSPSMNFLEATVFHRDGQVIAVTENGVAFQLGEHREIDDGHKVICGIRPEHFKLEGHHQASLRIVEPTGPDTTLICELSGHQLTVLSRERIQAKRGAVLSLGVDPNDIHVFDQKTGFRIEANGDNALKGGL